VYFNKNINNNVCICFSLNVLISLEYRFINVYNFTQTVYNVLDGEYFQLCVCVCVCAVACEGVSRCNRGSPGAFMVVVFLGHHVITNERKVKINVAKRPDSPDLIKTVKT